MTLFKNFFEQHPALRYIFDKMQFSSSLGHQLLLNHEFMTDEAQLNKEFNMIEKMQKLLKSETSSKHISLICKEIHQINNIAPTLKSLENGAVLDDIQLFEIKKTSIIISNIRKIVDEIDFCDIQFSETEKIVEILDPENTKIPHFYIYSAYNEELKALRNKINASEEVNEKEQLRFQAQQIEDKIREELSAKLLPFASEMSKNLTNIAKLDLLIAKSKLAIEQNACKPTISDKHIFENLTNPEVAAALELRGRKFQPVSITFEKETLLITGANMGGKSVLLQTVALAQIMLQFGFFVTADRAESTIFDEIICSFGDKQSAQSGLSSFAVEILTINKIIKTAKGGKRVLALVDELARTTNPDEGKQIVNGFLDICKKLSLTAIVTTHYSGIEAQCKRLRIKGLQIPKGATSLSMSHIADYMDYSLMETGNDEVPKEAFTIARLLHIDDDFISACEKRR